MINKLKNKIIVKTQAVIGIAAIFGLAFMLGVQAKESQKRRVLNV